ncbi:MAG: serine hydrolase domain-containing protein [Verrucomicrobiota bacterium]
MKSFPTVPRRLVTTVIGLISLARADPIDVSADLAAYTQDGQVPALAAAAILDGKIIAAGVTGVRKFGDPTPATLDDKFHIGSCTKSMTATLAAMLVADGKIQWNTTIAEVFPNFKISPDYREVTLVQLLSNTAGVPHDVPPELWTSTVANREEPESKQRLDLAKALLKLPPDSPPGTKNVYSNGGFTIAGAMLEKVSGSSYQKLAADRLFTPLHLTTAGFGAPATAGKITQPYGHILRDGAPFPIPPGPDADNPPAITPAGRVHLSILDLARYASFHLGTEKNALLPAASLKFLHTIVPPATDYALGWVLLERPWSGGPALYHNGTNTMNYTVMWLAPGRRFAAVATCTIDSGIGSKACDDAVSLLIRRFLKQ